MPAKDSLVYVMHIRDSCRRIAEYMNTGGDNWTSKPLMMDAVCRNITIIGEADAAATAPEQAGGGPIQQVGRGPDSHVCEVGFGLPMHPEQQRWAVWRPDRGSDILRALRFAGVSSLHPHFQPAMRARKPSCASSP